jgi:uncharacterized membrane protein
MPVSLREAIEIHAPPQQVFELVALPERLPEWNVSVVTARREAPDQAICLGSRAIFSGRLLGQMLETETEVIQFDPPGLFVTRAIRGPRLVTRFEVEPCTAGTRVEVQVSGDVPGGGLGAMLAEGFLRKELSASLDRLRGICEREAGPRDVV